MPNTNELDDVINDFCRKRRSEFSLSKQLDRMNRCFSSNSVDEILNKLENDDSKWAKRTMKVVRVLFFFHLLNQNYV